MKHSRRVRCRGGCGTTGCVAVSSLSFPNIDEIILDETEDPEGSGSDEGGTGDDSSGGDNSGDGGNTQSGDGDTCSSEGEGGDACGQQANPDPAALPTWKNLKDYQEFTQRAEYVRSEAIDRDLGETVETAGTRFETVVKKDLVSCHIVMKTSTISMSMKIATERNGIAFSNAAIAATITHETVHLEKHRGAKPRIDASVGIIDGAIQANATLGPKERAGIADKVSPWLNQTFFRYWAKYAEIQTVRQRWHLDHLAEEMRMVNDAGAVVGAGLTYKEFILESAARRSAFLGDVRRITGESYNTVDQAIAGINKFAADWDKTFDATIDAMKNDIANYQGTGQ